MAKYKVKDSVIAHSLKNNKIAKSGEVFDESELIDKELSLKGGYIELVVEEVKEVKVAKDKKKK